MFSFTDDEIVDLLSKKFISAATDIYYFERSKEPGGEFYRKVVSQRDGMPEVLKNGGTTQGFYIFDPDGKLYFGWNARSGELLKKNLKAALEKYKPTTAPPDDRKDPRNDRTPPKGITVVDVFAKITKANYPEGNPGAHAKAFRESTGRDHMWLTKSNVSSISRGKLPKAVIERMVRYHLNDFSRGEPPVWTEAEVIKSEMQLEPAGNTYTLTGDVEMSADRGHRRYKAKLYGVIDGDRDGLTRFDVVAKGIYSGFGPFTKNGPPGEFTLVVAFALAPPGVAADAPPLGVASSIGYLKE